MPANLLSQLFDTSSFPARWHCGDWSAWHGWTHIGADLAIFGAYMAIPLSIAVFMWSRRRVELPTLWWLFAGFILSCGVTHLVEATLFWHPWYRFSGLLKVTTAIISWATVFAIYRALPAAARLPALAQLNRDLQRSQRKLALTLNAIGDAVIASDENGKVTRVNPVAERLTGWTEAEALGHHQDEVLKIIREDDRTPFVLPTDELPTIQPQSDSAVRMILVARNGDERLVAASAAEILDEEQGSYGTVFVFRDITDELRAAEDERRTIERSMAYKSVLLELRDFVTTERTEFCRKLTQRVAEVLGVERVSVWFCNGSCDSITCEDVYVRSQNTHESGQCLNTDQAPAYFSAIRDQQIFSVRDVRSETMMEEISESFFKPLGVISVLHAPVRTQRVSVGVIWCGHTGEPRTWTPAEEEFLSAIASTIEVVMETEQRRLAEAEVQRLNHDLARRVDERTSELNEQRELMARLLDSLNEGVVACDESGKLSFFNRTARDWHGCDVMKIPNEKIPEMFHLFRADGLSQMDAAAIPLIRAYQGEQVRESEMVIAASNQPPRTVVCTGDQIKGPEGEILGAIIAMRDVTEQRRAEAGWRTAAERMELAVKTGKIGIWEPAIGTNEIVCNDQMGAIYGLELGEDKTLSLDDFRSVVHPADVDRVFEEFFAAHRNPVSEFTNEYRIKRRTDGETRFIRNSAKVDHDANGELIRMLGTNLDVTEERLREQALAAALDTQRELTRSAEAGERTKGEFLAVMSHELRTPMNAVIGFAELISTSSDLSVENRESVEIILRSSEGLLRIVNDVLEFSRMGAGHFEVDRRAFSPRKLLDEIKEMFRDPVSAKGLTLRVEFADNLPNEVIGDVGRTKQIAVNLINNAIKFTEHGSVDVRASYTGQGELEIVVTDTGNGLTPDELEIIFEPFRQRDSSLARSHGGTGLGLAISRRLAELMGGEVTAASQVGEGSTFTLSLPIATEDSNGAKGDTEKLTAIDDSFASHHPLRILVVDDDRINLRLATSVLKKLGYQPMQAADGLEAVAIYEREGADFILMDLQMPKMDGIEATRRIREIETASFDSNRVFISALTANIMPEDRERCFAVKMNAFLTKPLRRNELEAELAKAHEEISGSLASFSDSD